MIESKAWVDIYRPKKVSEIFLPETTKNQISQYVKDENFPSLLLVGQPGIGKTTIALAICNELDLEYMLINASLVGIDAVRTDIINFCSSIAMNGKRKVIILDEADGLTSAAQSALRGVINEFSDNVSFIITANFKNRLIEPLISRLTNVEIFFEKSDLKNLAKNLFHFIVERCKEFEIDYDNDAIKQYIVVNLKKSTDIRKIIIGAQKICLSSVFKAESIIDIDHNILSEISQIVKSRNFTKMRNFIGENPNITNPVLVRYIFDNIDAFANEENIAAVILIINQYQYQDSFVIDKEINNVSMLFEIMRIS